VLRVVVFLSSSRIVDASVLEAGVVVERSGEVDQTAGTWWVDVGRFLNSFCRTTTTTLNHIGFWFRLQGAFTTA
jgi:hypothetical protein